MHRRLAALLIADVVGYSRLMEADEEGTLARLRRWQDAILAPAVTEHGGRIVKLLGDGVLAEFASAVAAVSTALALQDATKAASRDVPEDRRIVLRIGVNLGEVVGEGDDIYGESVNVTARLEALAAPGEICVSGKVRDEVGSRVACRFRDMGEHKLKNLAHPVRVYRVSGDVGSEQDLPSEIAAGSNTRPSIAILPFFNMSADPQGQHLGDGLSEDLITELSRYRQLRVVARNSSFRFRGSDVDLTRAGRDLGAQFLVEGSVRMVRDRIRITAQLIEASSGHHIWAERFDRPRDEIFEVQDQVVRMIAGTVLGRVKAAVVETTLRKPPASLEAYECVLKADELPFDDPQGAAEAQRLFERALELDPTYARAHALFANLYGARWQCDTSESDDLLDEAFRLASRAVDLDSRDSACQQALGWVYLHRRSFALAEQHMRKAIDLAPDQPTAYTGLGALNNALGDRAKALAAYRQARDVDPFFEPQWYWPTVGCALYADRRYEEALGPLHRTTHVAYWIEAYRAACYARLQKPELARHCSAALLQQMPEFSAGRFAAKESFKHQEDERHLCEGLVGAGLPR